MVIIHKRKEATMRIPRHEYNPVPGYIVFIVAAWVIMGCLVLAIHHGGTALLKWAGVW